jgi:hypothetical protein
MVGIRVFTSVSFGAFFGMSCETMARYIRNTMIDDEGEDDGDDDEYMRSCNFRGDSSD